MPGTLSVLTAFLAVAGHHGLGQDVCNTEDCQLAAASIIEAMDITVDPCTDFFTFSCGGWIEKNVIPEGKSKWGRFYELRDKVDQAVKTIVETPPHPSEARAVLSLKAMYSGCMDTETIEAAGLGPFLGEAGENGAVGGWPMVLDSWTNEKFNLAAVLGEAKKYGFDWLISLWVYMDDLNTEQNVIYIDQPSLGLPLSMYLDEASYADYIAAYKKFMLEVATVYVRELGTGVTEESLTASVEEVFLFEQQIAQIMTPDSDRRNSTAMYNPITVNELKEQYGHFDWETYLNSAFAAAGITIGGEERLIMVQPDYYLNTQSIAVSDSVLANYIFSMAAMRWAKEQTQEMRDIAFRFTSVMNGVTSAPERWQTCTAAASGYWGFAAAHEYIMNYFDSNSKAAADMMVEDLRAAFKELVTESDWMDAATQEEAMSKAENMLQLIGYPDWLPEEAELDAYYDGAKDADAADHFGNVVSMLEWSTTEELNQLRKVPERDVWLMHPAIVNAWYSPNHNTITFPAGILQAPFFQGSWPRYLNYGAIGMVIGHEITHGFDDQGRQYDGSGNLAPWWTEETLQAFNVRAQCFIDQYGNYTVPEIVDIIGEEDAHLDGKNTQGENIADNGGIHESFRAYMKSIETLGEEPALPGLEQFTPEQMFFISFSQVWCEIQTPQSLLGQVLGDPHSPGKFRVIGPVSNSEDFQRSFNCPEGSPMVRPEKCKLW